MQLVDTRRVWAPLSAPCVRQGRIILALGALWVWTALRVQLESSAHMQGLLQIDLAWCVPMTQYLFPGLGIALKMDSLRLDMAVSVGIRL